MYPAGYTPKPYPKYIGAINGKDLIATSEEEAKAFREMLEAEKMPLSSTMLADDKVVEELQAKIVQLTDDNQCLVAVNAELQAKINELIGAVPDKNAVIGSGDDSETDDDGDEFKGVIVDPVNEPEAPEVDAPKKRGPKPKQ